MWEQLTIVDTGSAFFVAPADDPDDWVVSFQQRADFPAREWAERMISLYNAEPTPRPSPSELYIQDIIHTGNNPIRRYRQKPRISKVQRAK